MNLKQKKSNLMGEIVKERVNYTRESDSNTHAHTQRDRVSIRPVHMHGANSSNTADHLHNTSKAFAIPTAVRYTAARERAKERFT